jgi:glycosyltransferase involved in cell wall biosynthesis
VEFERLLRDLASASSLNGRVHFLGVRDDVHRLLNEFTLLAHAARQEPLGRVLLEAAASGTPVVATAVGGTREIFGADPCCALLVPPDEPAGLAAAIVRLLTDTDLRARLSHTARQRAERAFDARSAALALAAHYRQILDGPRDALG